MTIRPVWRRTSRVFTSNDLYFSSVSLLLHMEGSNGSTTFTDSSLNALTVTAVSPASISTTEKKFGAASLYNYGNGYIETSSSSSLILPFNFTIEFWVWPEASQGTFPTMFELGNYVDGILFRPRQSDDFYINNNNFGSLGAVFPSQTWTYVAIVRSGSTVNVYINGISIKTVSYSGTVNTGGNPIRIGSSRHTGGQTFNGRIDEFRITKAARYLANFTPPTAQFPNF